jgi:hypothetical protein
MAIINVPETDNFEQWRQKTNSISTNQGDVSSLVTIDKTSVVNAINEVAGAGFDHITPVISGSPSPTSPGKVQLGASTQSVVGANGAADPLTANPLGYLEAYIGTTKILIPYFSAP